ncbi:hypothetical protein ATKI12_2448 [Kitasatospora sp. Ki12]|uniref:hypothetical protein n=1 Tax=Kitasatospora xanthocidica TaxID=83382 RepID=UPI00167BE011|nr:hypothetical protein [Kitasatospora xanthocidica]GHF48585.1 hypothetical protein GCM10018790_27890 [Kitasatospora xanthocidica]
MNATGVGPSRLKDASLALLALPLLGAVLPVAVFFLIGSFANGPGAGDDGSGWGWGVLGVAVMAAPVVALVASLVVVVRSRRSGYRFVPVAAGIAPFVLPALFSSGVLW